MHHHGGVGEKLLVSGTLVTLAGPVPRVKEAMNHLAVIRRGSMLIADGKIQWVGPTELAPDSDRRLDLEERVITPGLVDAHAHPVFGGNRVAEYEQRSQGATYQEISAKGGGIQSTVAATRALTEEELFRAAKRHAGWLLANGTTTVEAKSGYGLSTEDELKILRVIGGLNEATPLEFVPTVLGAHAYPPEHADDKPGYLTSVCDDLMPRVVREGLAEYADVFCEERYFDLEASRKVMLRAKQLGLKLRVHADQLTRGGGAQLAAEVGAKTADHLEQTEMDGILALKHAGVQPVLLPASVFALGLSRYPNARAMIDNGLPVVLASDFNPGSSPNVSLPFVMSLASTQMKMTPSEALTACTLNAAYSLDRGHDRGSLEAGKRADFVVWDCEDPREIPYWLGAPLVCSVYVKGREVFSRNAL